MTKRVFKSSIYHKALFGLLATGVLVPGLWTMFYGIEKRIYNLPLLMIDLFICLYTLFIYAKFFSYKVVMTDEFIKIYDISKTTCIYYENIIDIKINRNECYIIDSVARDGSLYIRGTSHKIKHNRNVRSVSVNASKIPSIKRAYLEGYNEIIDTLLSKCGMEFVGEAAASCAEGDSAASSFISLSLLRTADRKRLSYHDTLSILSPYALLLLTFLISLLIFGTVKKGFYHPNMVFIIKLVFPLYAVITIFILTLKYIPFIKRIMDHNSFKNEIPLGSIVIFMAVNILLSAAVIALFFYIIANYSY